MLACEEANDAEVGEAGRGVAPLSPDFVDGEAVAACAESGDSPVGAGSGHEVEAEAVDQAEGGVEEGFGSILQGYEEERRLGGEVG